MNTATLAPLTRIRTVLDRLAGPQSGLCAVILLIARAYLFYVFFRSGLTKLHDWDTTVLLFAEEYKVPLLPPMLAAALGTFGELVFPSLMLIGIVPRLAAAGLFFVNLVAALSYWASLSASAIEFHFVWGMLIAIVTTVGPGWLALQTWWQRHRADAPGHAY
ncbi:DoxX family protein [Ralstonia sp. UBA689]|uniref:DoxX family protein n=1 Tax=Ralstonia sp. UBA689 TaxID=1947373 RepID=UPI0025E29505|nr:DoxX family protein [Ralstonia sp. UBA689]